MKTQSQFGVAFVELRRAQQMQIKQAKTDLYQSKRQEVLAVKEQLGEIRLKKQKDIEIEA